MPEESASELSGEYLGEVRIYFGLSVRVSVRNRAKLSVSFENNSIKTRR